MRKLAVTAALPLLLIAGCSDSGSDGEAAAPSGSQEPGEVVQPVQDAMADDAWWQSLSHAERSELQGTASSVCEVASKQPVEGESSEDPKNPAKTQEMVMALGNVTVFAAQSDIEDVEFSVKKFIRTYVETACPDYSDTVDEAMNQEAKAIFGQLQ
ncbi:hypothetical protein [Salinactinospora qingdaonensis]|uniref:DUF732 domain-containing protein n=1 Tax=Salinactinospora qingdaonensis TaxID=702744 RepID=A0ABP7GGF8_9ACTN